MSVNADLIFALMVLRTSQLLGDRFRITIELLTSLAERLCAEIFPRYADGQNSLEHTR